LTRAARSNTTSPQRVFPVVLAGFTAFLNLYVTQPLLPLLAVVFHATRFAVSLTIALTTVGVAMAAPLVGRLGDHFGRRRIIVSSALGMAVTTLLASTSGTLPQLIGWRFLQGLFTPGVFAVTIAYIHDQWPRGHAGAVTASYVSGTILGGFSGRIAAGIIASVLGWRGVFEILGVANLLAWAALSLWLAPDRRIRHVGATMPSPRGRWSQLARPDLLATYSVGFCVLFSIVATFTYVTFHLAAPPYELSTAKLGYLFTVYLAGAAITALGRRWMDRYEHRLSVTVAVAVGVTGTLLTLTSALPAIVFGLAVFCTGIFVVQATATSHIGGADVQDRGMAVGLYATCYYAGGSLGGSLPALFWDAGGWPACVALVAVVQLTMAAVAFVWWRERHTHVELANL
jgi:MFS family permease